MRRVTEEKYRQGPCQTIKTGFCAVVRDTTEYGHSEEPTRLLANIIKRSKAAGEIKRAVYMAMNSIVEAVPSYKACQAVLDPMFAREFALELTCAKIRAERVTRTCPLTDRKCPRDE